jgi:hypothetical protein
MLKSGCLKQGDISPIFHRHTIFYAPLFPHPLSFFPDECPGWPGGGMSRCIQHTR